MEIRSACECVRLPLTSASLWGTVFGIDLLRIYEGGLKSSQTDYDALVEFGQMGFILQHSLPTQFFHRCCSALIPVVIEALILILEKVLNCRYGLIIGATVLSSQMSFMLGNRNSQIWYRVRRIWEGDQPVQSNNYAQQPLQPQTCVQEHSPGETRLSSSVYQAVLTWLPFADASASWHIFPINSLAFLKVGNEHNAICIPEEGGHHLPCRWHHLGLLWRGRRGMFPLHGLSFGLWLDLMDPTLILGEETFKKPNWIYFKSVKFACEMNSLVCFWSGVKSVGTYRAETFHMPSSLYRMFSTRSRKLPTALINS